MTTPVDHARGSSPELPPPGYAILGTPSQVEWAKRIRRAVDAEFSRVATALRKVAGKQDARKRAETEAIIAILEDKRTETMNRQEAGYFIREWQEIADQVRQSIIHDLRYQAIKSGRTAGRP